MSNFVKFSPRDEMSVRTSCADATVSVSTRGDVSFRVLVSGMELLHQWGNPVTKGDRVDVYHEPETGRLAIKRDEAGAFIVGTNGPKSRSLRVTARRLRELVEKTTQYRMARERGYAFVLNPIA